jgi:polyisoprenoid-binding protein YceI
MSGVHDLLGSPDTAGVWNVVPERSTIEFKAKSMWGMVPVKGRFNEFSGDGQVTGNGGVLGRVEVRAASLHTGIKRRDNHLRSPDFFDVERFPDITVEVTAAEPTGEDAADLRASLTVRGTTAPIDLPAKVTVLDDGSIRVAAQTTVDRAKFGVTGNLLGMVGQSATISGDLVFMRTAG